jgi:hypothetical protein
MADERTGITKRDWVLATTMVLVGLMTSGLSLAEIKSRGDGQQFAQGTPPLQGSPATTGTAPPAESKPGGTRPTTPAPEPARPDADAQQSGAPAALPPAPAEKVAPPMKDK